MCLLHSWFWSLYKHSLTAHPSANLSAGSTTLGLQTVVWFNAAFFFSFLFSTNPVFLWLTTIQTTCPASSLHSACHFIFFVALVWTSGFVPLIPFTSILTLSTLNRLICLCVLRIGSENLCNYYLFQIWSYHSILLYFKNNKSCNGNYLTRRLQNWPPGEA